MSDNSKYYWLKLKKNFMQGDVVDFLMGQKDGANYIVLYQMLCFMAINTNGVMASTINEIIFPYNIDKIQRDCKYFTKDTIIVALELFKKLGLVYINQENAYVIAEYDELVGCETSKAKIMRKKRAEEKLNGNNVTKELPQCSKNVTQSKSKSKSKSKSLDIDKDLDKEKNNIVHDVHQTFESLWSLYPNKKGKAKISLNTKKEIHKHGFDVIKLCIERYVRYKPSWQEYQNGSTFFRTGYIDYLDKNFSNMKKPSVANKVEQCNNFDMSWQAANETEEDLEKFYS